MDELISREALISEVIGFTIVSPEVMNYANAVTVAIEDAPSIDAVPVRHGRWTFPWTSPECSVCRKTQKWTSKYCPNCGAKMDGGAEV